MSVPTSVDELVQLIRKSGMVDDAKLNDFIQKRQVGRGLPGDPREASEAMVEDGVLTNFQAEQFLLGKWRGFTIGKYKLLERVGVGGMGQVFLCEHMFLKKRVAIKVLPPAKAEQPAALGRFYREARAAGSLTHPNIVRTHDIDQDGNLHFIVMEYVDGSNLLDIVKKFGRLDIGRSVAYIRQVAAGLDYAFRNGIIHRDIKPGNVLIDRRGKARILDMGLARFFKDQTDMLTVKYDDKIVLGTADYVAPEQVANSHAVDIRADIYALGASLYFLLSGHPPFPNGTVSQKLLWHRTKDPTPIRSIRPEVPEGLAAVVSRMMMKDPASRYQTPGEVVAELEPFLPAEIPLPGLEEMPVLSKAALEAMPAEEEFVEEEMVLQPAGASASGAVVRSQSVAAPGKARSAAMVETPRTAARPATPFPASVAAGTGSTVVRELRKPAAAANPFGPPLNGSPSPWAAYADTPTGLADQTPIETPPVRLKTSSPFVVGTVTPNKTSRVNGKILAVVLGACVLAAGTFLFLAFAK
jgi:serine/threonine protein kinase